METKRDVAPPPAEAQGGDDDSGSVKREECSFDEAIARYEGEWVLFKITEFGEYQDPERGIVIAHSPDRGAISEALAKEPPRQPGGPYQPYYTFNAFFRLRPDETEEEAAVRVAALRAAAQEARRVG